MPRKKVLYAEDEYTNRVLLKFHFERHNIDVKIAEDGITALEMLENNKYDLIILDRYMPGMSGEEIVSKLTSEFSVLPPIIAISSDDSGKESLIKSGFSEILIKPVRKDKYDEIIKRYLS